MGITATDYALTRSVDGGKPFIGIETHLFELVFDVGATVGATVEVDVEDFMKTGVDHSNNNNNNNTDDDFVFIILIGGYSFDLLTSSVMYQRYIALAYMADVILR